MRPAVIVMTRLSLLFLSGLLLLPAQQDATSQKAAQQKAPAAQAKKSAAPDAKNSGTQAAPSAPQAPPAPVPPREDRVYNYVYDVNGDRQPGLPSSDTERHGTGPGTVVDTRQNTRGADNQPVTIRSAQERVLKETDGDRTSERTVQRYDLSGRPTSKQVIRTERKKMADGSIVTTETAYDTDLNGQLQFTDRRTTTERKTPSGGETATTTVERSSINGGTQVVERIDRVDTKKSETVMESDSSRKFIDINGRFEEREREHSVATKSGDATDTDANKWTMGATGQMELQSRTLSHAVQKADGSLVEDTQVYSSKIAGVTPDLNRPQVPTLEEQSHREKKVRPDGRIIDTTTTQLRQVANPTVLGGMMQVEKVTTPTKDGQTIETTIAERNANGDLKKVRSEIEQEKK